MRGFMSRSRLSRAWRKHELMVASAGAGQRQQCQSSAPSVACAALTCGWDELGVGAQRPEAAALQQGGNHQGHRHLQKGMRGW